MRRLVFCFDGTWNKLSNPEPTNVVLVAESIAPVDDEGRDQIVYYDEGVGTSKYDNIRGGAFGVGLVTNMREAYRFLIFNYRPGDEVIIFGFSRGAFTAMSFVGLLRTAGILNVSDARQIDDAFELYKKEAADVDDDSTEKRRFRAEYSQVVIDDADRAWREAQGYDISKTPPLKIEYLGVWDIVAALGVPTFLGPLARWWVGRRYGFHDARLSKTAVSARHAVAIDEYRAHFPPTLWSNVDELNGVKAFRDDAPYQQVWFPGDHSSIGGGGPERNHSNASLAWILEGAIDAGLKVQFTERSRIANLAGDYRAPLLSTPVKGFKAKASKWVQRMIAYKPRSGPQDITSVSAQAIRRWLADKSILHERAPYRPKPLAAVSEYIDKQKDRFAAAGIETLLAAHVVKQGESMGAIAHAYYGDSGLYTLIFDANRDQLNDPDRIYPGQILRIPPKPEESENTP